MSIHSFLDGVALAAGLVVGGGLGLVIAVVVVVHRFSDGISVVSLLAASHTPTTGGLPLGRDRGDRPGARRPARAGRHDPGPGARGLLAVFAGFFLYVGAAELLPEAHRSDRSRWVVVGTLGGVVAIYFFSVWAGAIG